MNYEPEKYWNGVAERISDRNNHLLIAGDDEPFYRYKRRKFLSLFRQLPFNEKRVLEVGFGPGGNLLEAAMFHPQELHGADVSEAMLRIASRVLKGTNVHLRKVQANSLPYADGYFDITYTVTVLQHNTNEAMLRGLIKELCRVSGQDVYIFERIERRIKGTELCLGRPIDHYQACFREERFELKQVKFVNLQVSYWVCGAIRKVFNSKPRKEGEREAGVSMTLQKLVLPFTALLDSIIKPKRDLAMLHFTKA